MKNDTAAKVIGSADNRARGPPTDILTLCTPNASAFKGLIDESQGESGTDAGSAEAARHCGAPSLSGRPGAARWARQIRPHHQPWNQRAYSRSAQHLQCDPRFHRRVDALPFTVHLEHGFFSYQPNLFEALARYNSYQTLGTWVGPVAVKPRTLGAEALGVSHPQRQDDASLGRAAAQAARHRVLHSDSGRVRAHAAQQCQGSLPAPRRCGILPRPGGL